MQLSPTAGLWGPLCAVAPEALAPLGGRGSAPLSINPSEHEPSTTLTATRDTMKQPPAPRTPRASGNRPRPRLQSRYPHAAAPGEEALSACLRAPALRSALLLASSSWSLPLSQPGHALAPAEPVSAVSRTLGNRARQSAAWCLNPVCVVC